MRSLSRLAFIVAIAIVFAPAGAHATTTSCNIPQPCGVFANNSGTALQGESAGADGVLGEAASGTIYGAGIEGESLKQTGADAAGTFGLTLLSNGVAPNYGVVAYGSLYGVYGQAGNAGLSSTGPGYGVFGQDNAGSSSSDYNVGVTGLSKNNVGVLAEANGAPSYYDYGHGVPTGLYAVGESFAPQPGHLVPPPSYGIIAESDYEGEMVEDTRLGDKLDIDDELGDFVSGAHLGTNTFYVTGTGSEFLNQDLVANGGVTSVHGGPYLRTTGASGRTVTAYSDHTTAPEMEDVGEAQLVNGRAFVPIDGALADVIDLHGGYHVFITPEGENKGALRRQRRGRLSRSRTAGWPVDVIVRLSHRRETALRTRRATRPRYRRRAARRLPRRGRPRESAAHSPSALARGTPQTRDRHARLRENHIGA